MRALSKRRSTDARTASGSQLPTPARPVAASSTDPTNPVHAVHDDLGHRAAATGDHRRPAGHRLDHAQAERLVEVDQVQQCRAPPRTSRLFGAHRADVAHAVVVDVRRDLALEVVPILNDPGDDQPPARAAGDLDRFRRALLGVDAAEEQQVVVRIRPQFELVEVDAVVDRRDVVELRARSASLIET